MKIISARVRNLYMRAFLDAADRSGSSVVKISNPALSNLLRRGDFTRVVPVLEGLGLIAAGRADNGQIYKFTIQPEGMAYFENDRAAREERCWTRGLAIAALVTSILSLASSCLSLFLQALSLLQQLK